MVDPMMGFKCLVQLMIAFPRIAVHRRFQRDFPGDNPVERLFRHVVHRLHVHDAIRPFINAKDGLLQLFGAPTTLDLAGFPQGIAHRPFAVAKFGATVGLIDFHFTIQQVNRPVFMGDNRVTQPMEKSMDLLIFQRQAVGNRAIRQLQFEPMQQFVHRCPGDRRAPPRYRCPSGISCDIGDTASGRRPASTIFGRSHSAGIGCDPRNRLHARSDIFACNSDRS